MSEKKITDEEIGDALEHLDNLSPAYSGIVEDYISQLKKRVEELEKPRFEAERECFNAGQASVGWRDDEMSRVDYDFETWNSTKRRIKPGVVADF